MGKEVKLTYHIGRNFEYNVRDVEDTKEGFGGVGEGGGECAVETEEAVGYGYGDEGEEDKVDYVDDFADCVEAWEGMGLDGWR